MTLWQKFEMWFYANLQVWVLFEKFTGDAINARRARFSADAVIQRIRWFTNVETRGDFKVNDHYSAYYARVFMACHPRYAGFFETREIAEDPAALARIVAWLAAQRQP